MRQTLPILWLFSLLAVACGHGGHGSHAHGADASGELAGYIARLEHPTRVAELQVERVLEHLQLSPASRVADLGAGPGVFALPLARALPEGLVYAVDVVPGQLDALRERAAAADLGNVIPVLASPDDPFLPRGQIDCVLVVDTYHHIDERVDYFRRLRRALAPGGRLAIVEWKPGEQRMGPPPSHKLAAGVRERELREAGYRRAQRFDLHEFHDFEIWETAGDS